MIREGRGGVADRNPIRLPTQHCSLAHFLTSAPLLSLVLGIRQLNARLDTVPPSPKHGQEDAQFFAHHEPQTKQKREALDGGVRVKKLE